MEIIIISLIGLAILLFIISFFKRDRLSIIEQDLEELSLQQIRDSYILKKRIQILEEKLLLQDSLSMPKKAPSDLSDENSLKVNEILKSQVQSLYQQGLSIDEISQRSTLSHKEIMTILQHSQLKGL